MTTLDDPHKTKTVLDEFSTALQQFLSLNYWDSQEKLLRIKWNYNWALDQEERSTLKKNIFTYLMCRGISEMF